MKRLLAKVLSPSRSRAARHLERGLDHESRADLVAAEQEYRRALRSDRGNQDAVYLLGSVCVRLGKLDEALILLERVVAANPRFAPAYRDHALALHASGRHAAAMDSYEKAISFDPSDPVPALNLAEIHRENHRSGRAESTFRNLLEVLPDQKDALARLAALLADGRRHDEALALLSNALDRRPDPDIAYQLGVIRQGSKDSGGARSAFHRAIALQPDHRPALHALGKLALRDAEPDAARRWLQRAFDADPSGAEVPADLGDACLRLKLWEESRRWLRLAIERDRRNMGAALNLALIEYNDSHFDEAERLYRLVTIERPNDAAAQAGLGRSLQQLGRFEEAVTCYRRALEIEPSLREALNNLGTVLQEMGHFEEAAAHFERTLAALPEFHDAWSNLGLAYLDLGRGKEAINCFDEVLKRDPGHDEARFNRAVARLRSGELAGAWDDYEARWGSRFAVERPRRFPEWDGGVLEGRRLLVYREQGLGDEIMFASCVPDIIAAGASVVLDCSPKLVRLFARSFPQATVVPGALSATAGSVAPAIDLQAACGSLPRFFRRELRAFPHHLGYLRADPARVAHWRSRLEELGPGPKLGLSWRGGAVRTRRRLRSLDLDTLMMPIHRSGATFVSLQYTDCMDEIAALQHDRGVVIHHWQEAIEDYDETAALVGALDAVITVCTAIVHLTGALGKRAFVMVPFSPEWRYGGVGERMPWYPGVRLIRQAAPGEWDQVLQEVSRIVDALVEQGGRDVLA